ncbi:MAG: hypothetical protein ILA34_05415 [Bacteroidaceae bacterium]|nr:hypothetical protein [Bacteroidaceae bacterium]
MRKLRLKWAFAIALFCAALPAVAQNSYYTFSPNFWADKEFVYDCSNCEVYGTNDFYSTIVKLPKIKYAYLQEGREYGIFVCAEEVDGAVWYGWDLGCCYYLEEEYTNSTNQYFCLEYDGAAIHHLNIANSSYDSCHCYEGEEDSSYNCGCLDNNGEHTTSCMCTSPYFEISDVVIPSTYSTLRIVIYRMAGDD